MTIKGFSSSASPSSGVLNSKSLGPLPSSIKNNPLEQKASKNSPGRVPVEIQRIWSKMAKPLSWLSQTERRTLANYNASQSSLLASANEQKEMQKSETD